MMFKLGRCSTSPSKKAWYVLDRLPEPRGGLHQATRRQIRAASISAVVVAVWDADERQHGGDELASARGVPGPRVRIGQRTEDVS